MSLRDKIERGRGAVRAGVTVVSAPDLFPTPPAVAARVAAELELFGHCRVLEPSAGTGALADAVRDVESETRLTLVEHNSGVAALLGRSYAVIVRDFLSLDPLTLDPFDRVVMNPPFSGGADMRHVSHACRFLKPGGVLVAIVADGPRQAEAFKDAEDLERLPSGTFQGTGVRARVIRIRN